MQNAIFSRFERVVLFSCQVLFLLSTTTTSIKGLIIFNYLEIKKYMYNICTLLISHDALNDRTFKSIIGDTTTETRIGDVTKKVSRRERILRHLPMSRHFFLLLSQRSVSFHIRARTSLLVSPHS